MTKKLNPNFLQIAQVAHAALEDQYIAGSWRALVPDYKVFWVLTVKNHWLAQLQGLSPNEAHAAWCGTLKAEGWSYSTNQHVGRRETPYLVEPQELTRAQRRKITKVADIVQAFREWYEADRDGNFSLAAAEAAAVDTDGCQPERPAVGWNCAEEQAKEHRADREAKTLEARIEVLWRSAVDDCDIRAMRDVIRMQAGMEAAPPDF